MIIALSLVVGITDALSMPSFQSIVPSIVGREQIAPGLALNSTQFNLSRILGPALAGVLMASVGAVGCFVVNAASYVPFIVVALWILPRRTPCAPPRPRAAQQHLLGGMRDIVREPHLRGALLTVLADELLCGPLITFCPVLVRDVLARRRRPFQRRDRRVRRRRPARRGRRCSRSIRSATGAGSSSCVRGRLRRDRRARRARAMVLGAARCSLVLAGIAMSVSNTSANSLLQAGRGPRLRGQTVSLYMLAMRGGMALGSLADRRGDRRRSACATRCSANGVLAVIALIVLGYRWRHAALPPSASGGEGG